jgi:phosphoglycolate phosphatase
MLKAVLFDMDGTLLYTLDDLAASVNYALGELGWPLKEADEVRRFVGNGIANVLRCSLPGADETTRGRALELFTAHYAAHDRDTTRPYDGVTELLQALRGRGLKTAIVSNKFDGAVKELAKIWFDVDAAVGEQPSLRRKPAADMVEQALAELGVTAAESIYIGDTEVDLQTALNSGCLPVLAGWGYRSRAELEALGDYAVIDTPAQLLSLLPVRG